jgi:hypothetical protein
MAVTNWELCHIRNPIGFRCSEESVEHWGRAKSVHVRIWSCGGEIDSVTICVIHLLISCWKVSQLLHQMVLEVIRHSRKHDHLRRWLGYYRWWWWNITKEQRMVISNDARKQQLTTTNFSSFLFLVTLLICITGFICLFVWWYWKEKPSCWRCTARNRLAMVSGSRNNEMGETMDHKVFYLRDSITLVS